MQVLCKSCNEAAETHCTVCGQGFALFWERQNKAERHIALLEIARTLRSHHHKLTGTDAHPQHGFVIADFDGPAAFSGAATLGHAPSWAL